MHRKCCVEFMPAMRAASVFVSVGRAVRKGWEELQEGKGIRVV